MSMLSGHGFRAFAIEMQANSITICFRDDLYGQKGCTEEMETRVVHGFRIPSSSRCNVKLC
jgi:hypothetical protein